MTQPTPTQTQHPWRAVARTIFALLVALATLLPYVYADAHIDGAAWGGLAGQVLAVAGGITRVLALPGVQAFLAEYVPWLAATPRQP